MHDLKSAARSIFAGCVAILLTASLAAAQDGRYIIKFKDGHKKDGKDAVASNGGRVVLDIDGDDIVAARIPGHKVQDVARNPHVESVEEDPIRMPFATWSNTTGAGGEITPYGIQMVQADKIGIDAGVAGTKKVCIIDSGYYVNHEDLKDSVGSTATGSGPGDWSIDSCGHGSHVAGTIAAIAGNNAGVVGANPGVSLHIVKVFGNDDPDSGSCNWTYASALVAALKLCTDAGANVVSMSLGGGAPSNTEQTAFNNAYKSGVLSIAAAGNAGNNSTSYPAGYSSVVSVAAVDNTETVASFSQRNKDVELAAPGVAVLSSVPWKSVNSLTAQTSPTATTWSGGWIEGAARTTGPGASGQIVDGGLCTASGAWSGAVVLCQRGTNSFADKVAKVKGGNGIAAVIYNNSANGCGVFEGTLNGTSTLPAIALSCADGAAAKAQASIQGTVVSTVEFAPTSTGGYEAWDGTSMATPHVSAVAAMIWACNPTKTNQQVRDAMTSTALDKGTRGRDNSYGFGIVQAKAALLKLGLGSCTVQ
jgi:serine protease